MVVGLAEPDARSQGITVVAKTEFASLEDMHYYDDDCPAHKALKEYAKGFKHETKPISIYFKPQIVQG